jgi:CubicO group peptidase (beta-lactamase class C family)
VVHEGAPMPAAIAREAAALLAPDPLNAPAVAVTSGNRRIEAAIDILFAETPGVPYQDVKALVIVHDGRIIAERYAQGYGPETPMHSWSIAKSVTNA